LRLEDERDFRRYRTHVVVDRVVASVSNREAADTIADTPPIRSSRFSARGAGESSATDVSISGPS
jgi:hypothetical protein